MSIEPSMLSTSSGLSRDCAVIHVQTGLARSTTSMPELESFLLDFELFSDSSDFLDFCDPFFVPFLLFCAVGAKETVGAIVVFD